MSFVLIGEVDQLTYIKQFIAQLFIPRWGIASKSFPQQMTTHHEGAVTIAKAEISDGRMPTL